MVKTPNQVMLHFSRDVQPNPFNRFQNHFENYMEFKRVIRVRTKFNDPKTNKQRLGSVLRHNKR